MIQYLPESIAVLVPAISLLIVGWVVERHYVGRITCFTNVMALNVHYLTIGEAGFILSIHALLGLALGLYGLLAYYERESLSNTYYEVVHVGYSSLVVGTILFYPQVNWLLSRVVENTGIPMVIFVVIVLIINLILLDDADKLHYRDSLHPDVGNFVRKYKIRVPDGWGGYQMVPLTHWFND